MDPELLVVVGKLNKLLDTISGKKGVPEIDKSSNIIPSQDGSTLPNGNKNGISFSLLKKIGVFFDIGKFQKQSTTIKYAKNFALGFLPLLKKTLEDVVKPLIKAIGKITVSESSGDSSSGIGKFLNLGGVAKSILIFIPALAAFTYIAKQWGGIEGSAITKMLGSLTIFLGGMVLISKSQALFTRSIFSVGSLLLQLAGLAGVIVLFRKSLEGWESISVKSILKVGAIVGGLVLVLAVLSGIPKPMLITGSVALLGLELLLAGLAVVLPMISTALQGVKNVEWSDIGKTATIIGGIAIIAGALGAVASTGLGALILGAGGIALLAIEALMAGLGVVLPMTAEGLKSVKDVEYSDMLKAATIISGLGIIAAAMGLISPLIGVGTLSFGSLIYIVDNINALLPKIALSLKSIGDITPKTIDDAFGTIKYFITSAGSLFGGETFFGKAGNFVKSIVGGTASAVAFAPYIAIATEISALSSLIKTTISNIGQIGGISAVQNSLNIVREFIQGAGAVTSLVTTKGTNNINGFITSLNNLIPSVTNFTMSLSFLKTTLSGFSADPFVGFKSARTTIDTLTDSVNRLKTSFGNLDVKSSINIVSDTPLKVDMTTTNEILYKMYQTSIEMVNVMKGLQPGGNNINIQQPMGGRNVQPGLPSLPSLGTFRGSPYSFSE